METLAGLGFSTGVVNTISYERLEELTGDPSEEVPRVLEYKNVYFETVNMQNYAPGGISNLADGEGGYDECINGSLAHDKIKDMEDDSENMYKQGTRTGRCTGPIDSYCPIDREYEIETWANTDSGDSGGAHFRPDPDNPDGAVYIAAVHYGSRDGKAIGYSMKSAEDRHAITVG